MTEQTAQPYQKWMIEKGVAYPIPGSATLYHTPGDGVFQLMYDQQLGRIGLQKISEQFTFDFKMYEVGCGDILQHIQKFWNNEETIKTQNNLGVIFNGIKGTGKTIAAKLLCNQMGLPVIIVSNPINGMLEFIQNLDFECIILIDEAEKTFKQNEGEMLLKLIDGVYNRRRKLYILTTNELSIDDNLIGRPGRIRYIKQFDNLSLPVVNAYLDDNLQKQECRDDILRLINHLRISTIDILKSIVEEANVFGHVDTETALNLPLRNYTIRCIGFRGNSPATEAKVRAYISSRQTNDLNQWFDEEAPVRHIPSYFDNLKVYTNGNYITDMAKYDNYFLETHDNRLRCGDWTEEGIVIESLDKHGFFAIENKLTHERIPMLLLYSEVVPDNLYKVR